MPAHFYVCVKSEPRKSPGAVNNPQLMITGLRRVSEG